VEANLVFVPATPLRPECFPAGTAITLADGTHKPIEQVEASEWVLTFDRATHVLVLVPARVTQRIMRQDAERQLGARLLSLTEAHAAAASAFGVEPTRVARLTLEAGSGPTYNLLVEGQHSYFAAGVLVHDRP
jgi:hypothetical protein